MCRPAFTTRCLILPVAMLLLTSVAAYFLVSGALRSAAAQERREERTFSLTVRSESKSCVASGAAGGTSLPSLSNRGSTPLTEGLREDRPTQVRVDVRRWRVLVLARSGKASRCGQLPNRRSTCRVPRLAFPPLSPQQMFCTWVI